MKLKQLCIATAAVALLGAGVMANAETINYSVSGWTKQFSAPTTPPDSAQWGVDGYPGDTVELAKYDGTLDLTPGSYTQQIGTLNWTIDYTYGGTATDPNAWSDLLFNFSADRSLSFGSTTSGWVNQNGVLTCTWENDFLTVNESKTSSFFVNGYRVDVTPLGMETNGSNFNGLNPWIQPSQQIMARFDVSPAPVPEPGTILAAFSILGPAGLMFRRRKA